MKHYWQSIILCILLSLSITSAHAESNPLAKLDWQVGPTKGHIGNKATIHVPSGYVFLDSEDTKKLMKMMENIPSDNEYVFAPDDLSWFAVFEFNPVGYIKDDETLDSQSLLDTLARGTEQGNIEMRKMGWSTKTILGWMFKPRYDKKSNLLEWAFLAKEDNSGSQFINYNTRLLGRTGFMSVVLVADPNILDASVASFKKAIKRYSFVSGEGYTEYREGDRVAEMGLAALITGGAAAVATKKGFWAVLIKFLVKANKLVIVAVIGLFALAGSFFESNK